jgi:hypothetical protein
MWNPVNPSLHYAIYPSTFRSYKALSTNLTYPLLSLLPVHRCLWNLRTPIQVRAQARSEDK